MGEIIRVLPILVIIAAGFIAFQNCGEFRSHGAGGVTASSATLAKYQALKTESAEFISYTGTSGRFFQRITMTFGNNGAFISIEESGVCFRTYSLDVERSYQLREIIDSATYRSKGLSFSNSTELYSELTINMPDQVPLKMYVVDANQELGLAPSSLILNERADFQAIIDETLLLGETGAQVSCSPPGQVPQFVEYVFSDVVNGTQVIPEAFLLEYKPSVTYLSLPDDQTCYQAYRLSLSEHAMTLAALSSIQTAVKSGPIPPNTVGSRFANFWFQGDVNPTQYFIGANYAADGELLLTNGVAVTSDILLVGDMIKARYTKQLKNPNPVYEADGTQRCILN